MNTALYILDRIFGCWLGRHLWSDEWEMDSIFGPPRKIKHRACSMANCLKHQSRELNSKKWKDITIV